MLRASRKAKTALIKAENLMKSGKSKEFYDAIFTLMQTYLALRFLLPSEGITEKIVEQLKELNINEHIVTEVKHIFSDCYLARYTSSGFKDRDMKVTLNKVRHAIDSLNKESFHE
jgi:hypothetical protein